MLEPEQRAAREVAVRKHKKHADDKASARAEGPDAEFAENGKLVVRAELPGLDPEKDVHVQLTDHVLEIRAEHEQNETHDENGVRRSELRYGSFYRMIEMPQTAKASDITAFYKDGILEVSIPLEVQPKPAPKAIPVATE
jgi:HSP20 family protein